MSAVPACTAADAISLAERPSLVPPQAQKIGVIFNRKLPMGRGEVRVNLTAAPGARGHRCEWRPVHQFWTACAALFDLLVSAQQNQWGYRKAERLGGLEVHDHLKLGRKLHR